VREHGFYNNFCLSNPCQSMFLLNRHSRFVDTSDFNFFDACFYVSNKNIWIALYFSLVWTNEPWIGLDCLNTDLLKCMFFFMHKLDVALLILSSFHFRIDEMFLRSYIYDAFMLHAHTYNKWIVKVNYVMPLNCLAKLSISLLWLY